MDVKRCVRVCVHDTPLALPERAKHVCYPSCTRLCSPYCSCLFSHLIAESEGEYTLSLLVACGSSGPNTDRMLVHQFMSANPHHAPAVCVHIGRVTSLFRCY